MTVSIWSSSREGLADAVALRREEGEHHAAADEQAVRLGEQVRDDAQLVGDLRAAEHDRVGALRVLGRLAQESTSLRTSSPTAEGEHLRHVVDRRLLAVHDAEAVGDEDVRELREVASERLALRVVLRRLARVEPDVLEQRDLAVAERGDRLARRVADDVLRQVHRHAEQLAQAGRDGREGVLRVRLALGAAEVRGDDHLRARFRQLLQRRERGADAPSSVMVVPSSGTLKSERTRTRLPRRSPRSRWSSCGLLRFCRRRAGRRPATGPAAHEDVRVRVTGWCRDAHADAWCYAGLCCVSRWLRASRRPGRSARRGCSSSPTRCRTRRRP